MRVDDRLTASVTLQAPQLCKKPAVEDRWVPAMVAVSWHRDHSGSKCAANPADRIRIQSWLICDSDHRCVDRFGQRLEPHRDRPADPPVRVGIHDRHHGEAVEGTGIADAGRDYGDYRIEPTAEEESCHVADEGFTQPGLQQLLAPESAGAAGREQDAGDQPAVAAAFSSCSTQLANRADRRWAISCMMPLRPNCATTPLTARSVVIVTFVPCAFAAICAVT